MKTTRHVLDCTRGTGQARAGSISGRWLDEGDTALTGKTCSACHERFESDQSFRGTCALCEQRICFKCWARGVRHCATHSSARSVEEPLRQPAPLKVKTPKPRASVSACAKCGAVLQKGHSSTFQGKYCLECQRALCRVPATLAEGAISIEEARSLERLFLLSLENMISLATSWSNDSGPVLMKIRKHVLAPVNPLPDGFLKGHHLKDALQERQGELPSNRATLLKARYANRRFLIPVKRMTVEFALISVVPLQKLLEQGYLTKPAGAAELTASIEGVASDSKSPRVNIVFSPTGWVKSLPLPEGTVLVWPAGDGSWGIRTETARADVRKYLRRLFDTENESDKIERCMTFLRDQPGDRLPLSAQAIVLEQHMPVHVVLEAFRRISREDHRYIVCSDDARDDWLLDMG